MMWMKMVLSRRSPHSLLSRRIRTTGQVNPTSTLDQVFLGFTAQKNAPILSLPVELIQHITSYLEPATIASFCLCSRYILYATGTQQLGDFLDSAFTKIERRMKKMTLERAFPSHWYCAWCDQFHVRGAGPREYWDDEGRKRACSEASSFLYDGKGFIVTYQHVRLAVNRALWGEEHGIGLDAFDYEKQGSVKINKSPALTLLSVEAKVLSERLILHSIFTITLPRYLLNKPDSEEKIMEAIPQLVGHHRNDRKGHTGMDISIAQALKEDWKHDTQHCSTCATDYQVSCKNIDGEYGPQNDHIILRIEAWRDLGSGRTPFEEEWRAHGEIGDRADAESKITSLQYVSDGNIRRSFEHGLKLRFYPSSSPRPNHLPIAYSFERASVTETKSHRTQSTLNNARIKATRPLFTPPYGRSRNDSVDLGSRDGI